MTAFPDYPCLPPSCKSRECCNTCDTHAELGSDQFWQNLTMCSVAPLFGSHVDLAGQLRRRKCRSMRLFSHIDRACSFNRACGRPSLSSTSCSMLQLRLIAGNATRSKCVGQECSRVLVVLCSAVQCMHMSASLSVLQHPGSQAVTIECASNGAFHATL